MSKKDAKSINRMNNRGESFANFLGRKCKEDNSHFEKYNDKKSRLTRSLTPFEMTYSGVKSEKKDV